MLTPELERRELTLCSIVLLVMLTILLVLALLTDSLRLWMFLSLLGEELVYIGLTIALAYLASPRFGFLTLVLLLLSGSLNIALKNALNIPRPPPELWRVPASGPGFPSGHTQISATFWTSLSLSLRNRYIVVLSILTVISTATSRVALRVHSIYDVMAGVILGVLLATSSYYMNKVFGFRYTVLALSMTSGCLSICCLFLGYEAEVSAAIAGLSLGITSSVRFLEDTSRKVASLSVVWRMISLLLVASLLIAVTLIKFLSPYLKIPLYMSLSVLISVAPTMTSYIAQSRK